MKKKVINIIILFITLSLVLFFTLKDDFEGVLTELKKANLFIIFLAIILFLISYYIKSLSLNTFLNSKNKLVSKINTYSLSLITIFANGITPFQSGGQPYQIYCLKKNGIRISDATSAAIKDFITYQTSLILLVIIFLISTGLKSILNSSLEVRFLMLGGLLLNIIILLMLIYVSFAKKAMMKLVGKLAKFTKLKNEPEKLEKVKMSLNNFYKSGSELKNNKMLFLKCILINMAHLLVLYMVPYVIFKAFNIYNVNISNIIINTSFVMLVGNFIPLPGGIGGTEYAYMQFFGAFVSGSLLSSTMLSWRFVTYVIPMLIGFIILIIRKVGAKK